MTKRRNHTGRPLMLGVPALLAAATMLLAACGGSGQGSDPGDAVSIAVTPTAHARPNPTKPIHVKAKHGKLTEVTVTNAKGKQVDGTFDKDKTSWHSTEPLGYDAKYSVAAQGKADGGKPARQHSTVHTLAPKATAYPSLIPPPNAGKSVGVGLPLAVQFDEPIKDKAAAERSLHVKSDPQQPGAWHWMDDKTVHYRPKRFWKPGTRIKLHVGVYGVDLGGGVYGKTNRDLDLKVHDSWVAKADGKSEKMAIEHNGKVVKTMPMSMGKDATPTHEGTHVISAKNREYTMDSCSYGVCKGDSGYYRTKEYFAERISNDGEFVHENPSSVGSQGSSNVSHGCINLNESNASWFFEHFGLGDVVEAKNSGGKALPTYDLYGDWSPSWKDWVKGSALHH